MKKCNKCETIKDYSDYYKKGKLADGSIRYEACCKLCRLEDDKAKYWSDGKVRKHREKATSREEYLERRRATYTEWREKNQAYNVERCKAWREANQDKRKEYNQANKHLILANTRARQVRLKVQTPPLSDKDRFLINALYFVARVLTDSCDEPYEVDHMIPVSKGGLHTFDNLQVLTRYENRKKATKILRS